MDHPVAAPDTPEYFLMPRCRPVLWTGADITPHRSLDPVIALGARAVLRNDAASRMSLQARDVHMKTGPQLHNDDDELRHGTHMYAHAWR